MTTKRIVYTRPDGGVSVVSPAPALVMEFHLYGGATGTLAWSGPAGEIPGENPVMSLALAEGKALAFVQQKDVPGGVEYNRRRTAKLLQEGRSRTEASAIVAAEAAVNVMVCTVADCPSSRRFRNAWRQVGAGPPVVDMPLARAQRMNEVRVERSPKLVKSDVDYVRAVEQANTTLQTRLKDYRQRLRDLPATEQPNVDAITIPEALETWQPTWPVDPA